MMTETAEKTPFRFVRYLVSIGSVVIVLIAWYLLTGKTGRISSLYLPSPRDVIDTLVQVRSTILEHSLITLRRVIESFVLGCALGIAVGLIMSRYQFVFALLEPVVEALRPVPPIALIPFFILWFGIGDFGKLLLAGEGCFMVMVISTIESVRNVPRIYIQAAQSLGASKAHIYRTVIIPAIVPELIAGWRVALALAFALMVAAELMGAQQGLGFMIMVARRSLNTPTILLGIIIIGIEAALADQVLRRLGARLTAWTERNK
jgi:taurine transport system permease protein